MKKLIPILCLGCMLLSACEPPSSKETTCTTGQAAIDVSKVWSSDKYCAFTSIVKFGDRYYIAFREGEGHVFDKNGIAEGNIRVVASDDGNQWHSVALFHKDEYDLRDPKLCITPDNRLMVTMGGSIYKQKQLVARRPQVAFSSNGKDFTELLPMQIRSSENDDSGWPWRVTWHGDTGYTVSYSLLADKPGQNETRTDLFKTTDGIHYEFVTRLAADEIFPNEATLRFLSDGRMLMLLRQEKGDRQGIWGISLPPYTEWNYKKIGVPLGGPDFLTVGDSLVIAGTRMHYLPHSPKTLLMKGNLDGNFEEICILPSKGDNSYPGLLVVGDELWVTYYSQHEQQKASIYLAKMPLDLFKR